MLEKLEAAYLAVMRVVVLVAATLALIVCFFGASAAAPSFLRQLGVLQAEDKVPPVMLSTFMAQQRAVGAEANSSDDASEVTIVPAKVAQAARIIDEYLRTRSREEVDLVALQQILTKSRNEIEFSYQADYDDSLLGRANELKRSTGKALPLSRVAELLDWQHTEFLNHIEAKRAKEIAEAARASTAMMTFAGGLAAFILILFFFLFVKIERNLRLVRTKATGL